MRFGLLLCVFLTLISCDIDYNDNLNLQFKGVVNDENGRGLPGISIKAYAYKHQAINSELDLIGEGKTDLDGNYEITARYPKDSVSLSLRFNEGSDEGYKENYASYSVFRIEKLDKKNEIYVLPSLRIEQLTEAVLNIRRTNNSVDTLYYSFSWGWKEKSLNFDLPPNLEEDFPFQPFDTIYPQQTLKTHEFDEILRKDTIQFRYRLSGSEFTESIKVGLLFDEDSKTYVFDF